MKTKPLLFIGNSQIAVCYDEDNNEYTINILFYKGNKIVNSINLYSINYINKNKYEIVSSLKEFNIKIFKTLKECFDYIENVLYFK